MKVSRTSRLNGEYQKEISEIIRLNKDRMPDLKTAIVYVRIYGKGEEEAKRSFAALQEHAGFIRHQLSQVMRMRTVPALSFRLDGSMVYGAKMDQLFKTITYSTPEETDKE